MTAITAAPLSPPSCSCQGHASSRLLPAANPFPPDGELLLLVTGSGTPHLRNQNVLKISYSLRFFLPSPPSSRRDIRLALELTSFPASSCRIPSTLHKYFLHKSCTFKPLWMMLLGGPELSQEGTSWYNVAGI